MSSNSHTVVLLPAHHVRPDVRRNKSDRADAAGLLEADRCADIRPVRVKTPNSRASGANHKAECTNATTPACRDRKQKCPQEEVRDKKSASPQPHRQRLTVSPRTRGQASTRDDQ
jgi:transposase